MIITKWFRKVVQGGQPLFEFNHIENGYDEAKIHPTPKFDSQKGWVKGTWRAEKAQLIDGKVVGQ